MTKRFFLAARLLMAASSMPPAGLAEHHEEGEHHGEAKHHGDGDSKDKSVESLSPELRALLQQEMQALQTGMVSAFPALVSGNLAEVAEIARKMQKKATSSGSRFLKSKCTSFTLLSRRLFSSKIKRFTTMPVCWPTWLTENNWSS